MNMDCWRCTGWAVAIVALSSVRVEAVTARPQPRGWVAEKSAGKITVIGQSRTVAYYGAGKYHNELRITCDVESHKIDVAMRTSVKTVGPFVVRFDSDPARQLGTSAWYTWASGNELRVPAADTPAFVDDARTHSELLLRHDFGGRLSDVVFDLAGLEAALEPMREPCALKAVKPVAPVAAKPAARPAAPAEREVGRWHVRESRSALDDKPVVVLSAVDATGKLALLLRCQETQLEAFFVIQGNVFNGDSHTKTVTVSAGVDGGTRTQYVAPTTDLFEAAFLPDGRSFASALTGHHSVELEYTLFKAATTKVTKIDISGIDKALEPLLTACPAASR